MSKTEVLDADVEVNSDRADSVVKQEVRKTWKSYIWDSFDKSPEERKFLFKLDSALLTIASLGYFIKYLDQANINNAFVSGMKEDLGLYGNQLNYMQTMWTIGYVIGEIPSNMILTRVRPSIWIPTLQVIWTILTMCLSKCSSARQVYALRFLVGLAESGFYPGMQYVIGSWYRKDELAKRSCIFHASSGIATMVSGYLMAAVIKLNGNGGLAGWQWLFVMDGVMSLPIAFAGFFLIPDVPETSRALYFKPEEVEYAKKRMQLEGREQRKPYTKAKFRKIFTSWHIYVLSLLYICFNNGNSGAAPVMAQYLKDSTNPKYSIAQINDYPTPTYAVQVVTTLAYAWISDSVLNGRRWPPIIFGALMNIVVGISLAVWNIPVAWKWACYYLAGFGYGLSGLCMAWAHEICADDNEERAIVVASMNDMAYVLQAWLPLIVWQQVDAPQYRKGFITVTCLAVLLIIVTFVTRFLAKRERLRKRRASPEERESGSDMAKPGDEMLTNTKKANLG